MLEEFENFLRGLNLSENTVKSYLYALKQYQSLYGTVNRKSLRDYKVFLQETYKPQTVNLRIRAINCYLESIQKENWQITCIKMQQKTFLENVLKSVNENDTAPARPLPKHLTHIESRERFAIYLRPFFLRMREIKQKNENISFKNTGDEKFFRY